MHREIGEEKLIAYVGRITPYKHIEDLLYAWRIVEKKVNDSRLVIAGRPDLKYLSKLIRLARRLGLRKVLFRTNISHEEKLKILARAKAIVYTSIKEGWGQTVMEAAICGTPTIAYNVPGLRDAIKH